MKRILYLLLALALHINGIASTLPVDSLKMVIDTSHICEKSTPLYVDNNASPQPEIIDSSVYKRPAPLTKQNLSVSVYANPGWMAKFDKLYQIGRTNFAIGADISYQSLPVNHDAYAHDYDYPTLSLGIKYGFNHGSTMHRTPAPEWGLAEEVDYITRLGNTASLIGTFSRPLYRHRRFEVDMALSMGVAYSHSKYDKNVAIDNDIIGSRWLIHFGAGLHVNYRIASHWGIRAGVDYWHVSNGAMNRPNKGANYVGPVLALQYYLDDDNSWEQLPGGLLNPHYNNHTDFALNPPPHFKPYTYLRFTLGVGCKTMDEEWKQSQFWTPKGDKDYRKEHFRHYVCYSLNADFMVRYARRWASGIGIDMFYGTYADDAHRYNVQAGRKAHTDPFSIAIAGKHEVFYHNFSMPVSLGVYLYRAMGALARDLEKPYYETVGLHYTFPSLAHLRIGINVKAHLFKADYTELALSCPIRL